MQFKLKRFNSQLQVTRIANIHYFEFTNDYHTKKDCHPFCELIYTDNGSLYIEAEGFCGTLDKHRLIIHRPNEVHSITSTGKTAPAVIIIGFECVCEQLNSFSQMPVPIDSEMQKLLAEIIKEGRNVFLPPYDIPNQTDMKKRDDYSFGADQLIKNLLETFLIKLVRLSGGENLLTSSKEGYRRGLFGEVSAYIDGNLGESFNLAELCLLFKTNKTTLCKVFKENTDGSVIEYVNRKKIRRAKALIREGEKTFTEIADELGFCSVHYFSKMFKAHENMSPTEYISTIKSKLEM